MPAGATRVLLCYRAEDFARDDVFSRIVPAGLTNIHGVLRAHGFDSRLHNFTGRGWRSVERTIAEFAPAVVGVSHFTFNHPSSVRLYGAARRAAPGAVVIGGGPQATHLDAAILARAPGPDVIVRGEGETAALALVREVAAGLRDWSRVPGVSWLEGGEVRRTPEPTPPDDLDPFYPKERFDEQYGIDPDEQYPVIITSRGCPAQCTFCNTPLYWGTKVRFRSARAVVDEIDFVRRRWGIRFFSVRDDTFTARTSRVLEFCHELLERRIFVLWNCQSRVNLVDEQRLSAMKAAGCDQVQFGVESASPRILAELNKSIRPDQIARALRLCREIGLKTSAFFITGVPGETEADVAASLALFEEHGLMDGIVAPLAYYPGTALFDRAKERGEVDEELFLSMDPDPARLFVENDPCRRLRFDRMVAAVDRKAPRRGWRRREIDAHLARSGRCHSALLDLGAWHEERGHADAAEAAYTEMTGRFAESPWGWQALAGLHERAGRSRRAAAFRRAADRAARGEGPGTIESPGEKPTGCPAPRRRSS